LVNKITDRSLYLELHVITQYCALYILAVDRTIQEVTPTDKTR